MAAKAAIGEYRANLEFKVFGGVRRSGEGRGGESEDEGDAGLGHNTGHSNRTEVAAAAQGGRSGPDTRPGGAKPIAARA